MANESAVSGGDCSLILASTDYGSLTLSDNMSDDGFHLILPFQYNRQRGHGLGDAARKIRKIGLPRVQVGVSVRECRDAIIGLILSEYTQPVSGGVSLTESHANKLLPNIGDLTLHPVEDGAATTRDFVLYNCRCVPENLDFIFNNQDGVTFWDSEILFEGVIEPGETIFDWGVSGDVTAPDVASSVPTDGGSGIAVDATVTVTFNDNMHLNEVVDTSNIFIIKDDGTLVGGQSITYQDGTKTITIAHSDFDAASTYIIVITPAVHDTDGNAFAAVTMIDFDTA